MKKLIIVALIVFSIIAVKAQKKQNIYFLKNNGKEVALKDSADFVRVIQEPDSGETNYVVTEFYKNGNRKSIGKVSYFEPRLIYEGVVVSYNDKGKKIESVTYENGNMVGMAFYFFNNGLIHKQVEYLPIILDKDMVIGANAGLLNFLAEDKSKLIYQADSLGVVAVKDGSGHLITTSKIADDELTLEGDYKDGFKDGLWKGKYKVKSSTFEEVYSAHKLVSGINKVDDKAYPYTAVLQPPKFEPNVNEFYQFLGRSIKYPRDAAQSNITGTVILSFTIEKDGTTSDIVVVKSVYPSIDEEAKRVVKYSPKWKPATERGLPVKVKYTIPIKFSLGR